MTLFTVSSYERSCDYIYVDVLRTTTLYTSYFIDCYGRPYTKLAYLSGSSCILNHIDRSFNIISNNMGIYNHGLIRWSF